MKKFYQYEVEAFDENHKLIAKRFNYRKSAEKFGIKLVEKYGHCMVHTFDSEGNYLGCEHY